MWGYGYRYFPRAGYPYMWGSPVVTVPGYSLGIGRGRGFWSRVRGRGRGFWWWAVGAVPPVRTTPMYLTYYGMPYARGW